MKCEREYPVPGEQWTIRPCQNAATVLFVTDESRYCYCVSHAESEAANRHARGLTTAMLSFQP